jgi:hypothetical protein
MEKMEAAEAVRRLARQYEAMVEAANTLERIGSLEQAEKEANERLFALNAREVEAQRRVEDADRLVTLANQGATEAKDRAEAQCREKVAASKAEAQAIVENARTEAQGIVSAARTEAEGVRAQTEQERRVNTEAFAAVRADVLAVQADLERKRAELADIEGRIAAARAQAAAIIGA